MPVKIQVNDIYDFDLDPDIKLDYHQKAENTFHILENDKSYNVVLIHSDFAKKIYKIKVNGTLYIAKINDELDQLIKQLGLTIGHKQIDANLTAPMPGLILDVQVVKGQEVKEGDALLVLEAMKMENTLVAPKDGVIKSVQVAKGDAVDKKQLLIEME